MTAPCAFIGRCTPDAMEFAVLAALRAIQLFAIVLNHKMMQAGVIIWKQFEKILNAWGADHRSLLVINEKSSRKLYACQVYKRGSIAGGLDAELLQDHLSSFGDPEVFAVSHLGWGLSDKARWSELALYEKGETEGQDGRAFYGNFLFSTGPNLSAGGTRAAACHLDIPMRGCSLSLDDRPVVVDGDVIVDALQP